MPTIYLAGDSTSTDQPVESFNSWGRMITRFLTPDVAMANHGESGESLRSFIGEKRLDKVMSLIASGDYLLIQMGHNDQKDTTAGAGAFTSYKQFLEQMISAARGKDATPILITPVNRLIFDAHGKIANSLGDFPEAVRRVAAEQHVPLIDLNTMSKLFYEALGPVQAHVAFAGSDTTHHSDYGSYELAKCIVQAMNTFNFPLAKHISADFTGFDPAHPDRSIASIYRSTLRTPQAARPYGN